jgi:hypothetical protein
VLCLVATSRLWAQTEAYDHGRSSAPSVAMPWVSDYQCIGINPANLGFVPTVDVYALASPLGSGITRQMRSTSLGIGEVGVSVHSDALPRSGLLDALFMTSSGSFNAQEKQEAARAFMDKGLRFNVDVLIVGASHQTDDYGGFAFTARERVHGTFVFNSNASQLVFQGKNFPYFDSSAVNEVGDTIAYSTNPQQYSSLFAGTTLAMVWFREYALSYGICVGKVGDASVYLGATGKYLSGYALLDAATTEGAFRATSSLSPFFGINYGKATSPSLIRGNNFIPVGNGFGADLGITVTADKWRFSASAVDIGAMEWTGNVFEAKDTVLNGLSSSGFNSYNIFVEAPKITGDGEFFVWQGLQSLQTQLPTRLRASIGYEHTTYWRFGLETTIPIARTPGSMEQLFFVAGADWRPTPWLRVGAGLAGGGSMRVTMPVGASFSLFGGLWELGLSIRCFLLPIIITSPVVGVHLTLARLRL